MKRTSAKISILFYLGILFCIAYEILKVYFIMPFPGSQRSNTLSFAFYLNRWSPVFRIIFGAMICFGAVGIWNSKRKWIAVTLSILGILIVFMINTKVRADVMFQSPKNLVLVSEKENKLDTNAMVIAVEHDGQAQAFPIRLIAYHHIVYTRVGTKEAMITYCDVCHSGRVYSPKVKGSSIRFRLVGMDHFNAMFEDPGTKSWWRQETGECVMGPLKGEKLEEIFSMQMTIADFFEKYPNGLVMQPDPDFMSRYDLEGSFEQGKDKSSLTRTDTIPWQEKSLVLGVSYGSASKAYDWNELKRKKIINDEIAGQKIVLIANGGRMGNGGAFLNMTDNDIQLYGDTLVSTKGSYNLAGKCYQPGQLSLSPVTAYQEFWHSWKTFHPNTEVYPR